MSNLIDLYIIFGYNKNVRGSMKKFKTILLLVIFCVPIMLVGCRNTNKNIMDTPTELTVSSGGYITFARVSDDEYYVISINDIEFNILVENSSPYIELYNLNNTNYLRYDASRFFTLGESYNVKVKACANEKTDSAYTNSVTYTHTKPIDKTTNIQIVGTVLTWDSVEYSSSYIVKVITPSDTEIKDYEGNIIGSDDAESVANADLTMYQFSTNRFDFSSILSRAGEYKFYINAVSASNVYSDSGYTYKTVYRHIVDLSTPVVSGIHKVSEYDETSEQFVDNFHLIAVVDANTTAIEINCNSISKVLELNNAVNYVSIQDNMLDINLNKYFLSEGIDLCTLGDYSFKIRSVDLTENVVNRFYNDSNYSETINLNVSQKLSPAEVEINFSELNNSYVITWSAGNNNEENIAGYAVYVMTTDGVNRYEYSQSSSLIVPEKFISASVQVLAKGNYISSALSEFLSVLDEEIVDEISLDVDNTSFVWTAIDGATYVVEINDQVLIQTENFIDMLNYDKINSFSVTYVLDGYIPLKKTFNVNYHIKLETPTIDANQGFVSTNTYLLTFTPVEGAIGYYVYLLGDGMTESIRIPRIFTTTSINLSQYIINQGEYINYQVQIQAVADPYSARSDSDLTELGLLEVSHSRVLNTPEFRKNDLGENAPIEKVGSGNNARYYLNFYGVTYADSYEIMINFNRLTQANTAGNGLYRIDITRYMTAANSYTIMVRALPTSTDQNVKPSEYNIYEYVLTMQLDEVTNIRVAENDGVYTLSFDMQENATSYRIRIVKLNDGNYSEYLNDRGLDNPFEVIQSADITDYVREAGMYYIYVTALANKQGGYYGDSDESTTYGVVNKLSTLDTPTDIQYLDESRTSFIIRWTGDEHADYYTINVTDPNGKTREYMSLTNQYNINSSITVEGAYIVNVKAQVKSTGENASLYMSSPTSDDYQIVYEYLNDFDYSRYSVYIFGEEQDFVISDINDLKNILWYHYLFGVNENYYLNVYLNLQEEESTYDAILRLADEAKSNLLYDFSSDSEWLGMLDISTEGTLFSYICTQLLELYPEMAVLDSVEVMSHSTGSQVFKINYSNVLDVEKVETNAQFISQATDYTNDYDYLDAFSRRSSNASFAIDSLPTMDVETTEQLLHAVQYGRKPNFVGDSQVAETVYYNARTLLIAIVNNSMPEVEKVTRIFDWLEYALNLNYYAEYVLEGAYPVRGDISQYGTRAEFYLEGLFLNLTNELNGGFDGEFYLGSKLATNELYAKAFTLLCSIEGLTTRKINGEVSTANSTIVGHHTWNKVYIDALNTGSYAWYSLDLMYSDNRVVSYSISQSYGISSHLYFLVTDNKLYSDLGSVENTIVPSEKSTQTYDYYAKTTFGMTVGEINSAINENNAGDFTSFEHELTFMQDGNYQTYNSDIGQIQAYILNTMFYSAYKLQNNKSNVASFEFKISSADMGGGETLTEPNRIEDVLKYMNRSYNDIPTRPYVVNVYTVYDSESESESESGTAIYIYTFEKE